VPSGSFELIGQTISESLQLHRLFIRLYTVHMSNTTNPPIIYADFHGLHPSARVPGLSAIMVDTYGSLRDLTNQQAQLKENMPLIIFMDSDFDEDIEADAVAYYDRNLGMWMAEIDYDKIRDVPLHTAIWNERRFLCFSCHQDLEPYFAQHGRNAETRCPHCSTSIMTAVAAP
jgi:hypothetical protein